jgi:glutaredoxin 3
MMKIEIYTRPDCGYCTDAKRLLTSKGLEFIEYDVGQNLEIFKTMQKRTTGRTFPQIFIEDKLIGG